MKTILCYGDSNTWGAPPGGGERLDIHTRWAGVLRNKLGPEFHVLEEGLGGRTTVWDDPIEEHKNGKTYLIPCLESHQPIALVIIMLGTNDLKHRFSLTAFDIAKGAERLVKIVQKSSCGPDWKEPKVLLIAPPRLSKLTGLAEMFKGGEEKSGEFGVHFKTVAEELSCAFLDADKIITSGSDGIHYGAEEHKKLGEAVYKKILEIL